MHVRDLMTANPVTVAPEDSLETAMTKMVSRQIRALPVVDNGVLAGILTDRDLKMALGPDARSMDLDSVDPRQLEGSVEWFMTPGVATVEADADLAAATQVLVDMRVGALPVVHNGDLVGILSVTDVLKEAVRRFA